MKKRITVEATMNILQKKALELGAKFLSDFLNNQTEKNYFFSIKDVNHWLKHNDFLFEIIVDKPERLCCLKLTEKK